MELPHDKRPPRSIWHNEYKLDKWFEEMFENKSSSSNDGIIIDLDEVD